jgi:uncharacterized protein (DUF1330 family)
MKRSIMLLLVCGMLFSGPGALAQQDTTAGATSVYIIAEIDVHDKERYEDYRKQVAPLIARHGGRYLVRSGAASFGTEPSEAIVSPEGNWLPDRIIVLEFPSRTHLERFVADPEYKRVAAIRQAAATMRSIVVDGYVP